MQESEELENQICKAFGNDIYEKGKLQKKKLADIVFSDSKKLQELNNLAHPFVHIAFDKWLKKQDSEYVIKEAAILFEGGANKGLDAVICVSSPMELRIKRVMERDKCSRERVMKRMAMQMPQETKEKLSDFVIVNTENEKILPQILSICKKIELL
jgi:dephospho-CoA kinase